MNTEMIQKVSEIVSPVYQVGGSVRDMVLGREPKDFDFATPLHVDEVEALIKESGRRAYQIGNSKRHGTMACKVDGVEVEITTFRMETYVSGSRQPTVTFTDNLRDDLSRRDFTFNAMAVDKEANLIDFFGGQEDAKNGVIRFVGDAAERINEDPLRILRAFRFMSVLGSNLHESALGPVYEGVPKMHTLSKERIVQEMDKILMGEHVGTAIRRMRNSGALRVVLPLLADRSLIDEAVSEERTLEDRWIALFRRVSGVGDATPYELIRRRDIAKMLCGHFKFSKERTTYIVNNI